MPYSPPLADMTFVLNELCDLEEILAIEAFSDFDAGVLKSVLEEAAKFASGTLEPTNRIGDLTGVRFSDGKVACAPEWLSAYKQLVEMGWNSPAAKPEFGGMGIPEVINACIQEMFHGANMSFQLCSMLTQGAVEVLTRYGSSALQDAFLPQLVSGCWAGTMNLTEPQAGSDLSKVRTMAQPNGDHYRISGQKIFISYGDHDLVDNIVHLVLARVPNAPEGVKGLSLFAVPKLLPNPGSSELMPNDVICVSVEHKLGLHGSPTCTMSFGERGGAVGYLVGAENEGLANMFVMMNEARLNVGIQAIGVSEHAFQDAYAYAQTRKQGSTDSILGHADVQRMLALMKARTFAMRILAYRAAAASDRSKNTAEPERASYFERQCQFLVPVVKGLGAEWSIKTTSLGVQVHGGMGYVEETGVAQHLRDARVTSIYEGTTGIQAQDFVGRKIIRDRGRAVDEALKEIRDTTALPKSLGTEFAYMLDAIADFAELAEHTVDQILTHADEGSSVPLDRASDILEGVGTGLAAHALADAAWKAEQKLRVSGPQRNLEAVVELADFFFSRELPLAMTKLRSTFEILKQGRKDSDLTLSLGQ